ncbi:MAG: leucine-rich repeat domain-containing protein [Treponema sp.]|nr:leucine-rich repeat domain-containing protein [Treponema sp.]
MRTTIALFLLLGVFFIQAEFASASGQKEKDYITDGKGAITGYTGNDSKLDIPARIDGEKITSIGEGAFRNRKLTSVTIPNSVTLIGFEAFKDNNLTNITIKNNVSVRGGSFENNRITNLTIGNNCSVNDSFKGNNIAEIKLGFGNHLQPGAFNNVNMYFEYLCNNRKSGTYDNKISYSVNTEGDYKFVKTRYGAVIVQYTGNQENPAIPEELGGMAVKGIGCQIDAQRGFIVGAFDGKNISSVQIPKSVIFIDNSAFKNNRLVSIVIPDGVTYIGDNAFLNNRLTTAVIGNNVVYIGSHSFFSNVNSANNLTSVTFGKSVKYIGDFAFAGNASLNVVIPKSVVKIGVSAFEK